MEKAVIEILEQQRRELLIMLTKLSNSIQELRKSQQIPSEDIAYPVGPYRHVSEAIFAFLSLNKQKLFSTREVIEHVLYMYSKGIIVKSIARWDDTVRSSLTVLKKNGDVYQPSPGFWRLITVDIQELLTASTITN